MTKSLFNYDNRVHKKNKKQAGSSGIRVRREMLGLEKEQLRQENNSENGNDNP